MKHFFGTISLSDQSTKDIVLQTCKDSDGYYDEDKYMEAIQNAESINSFLQNVNIDLKNHM